MKIVELQKLGVPKGIYSICSANEYVIEAAMDRAQSDSASVLIEATANQVNQFGGYTGMKPADFRDFVWSIAEKAGFPVERIILGGDHLGPLTWKKEKAEAAMEKAAQLVRQYVLAGFTKIHIDTSMRLGDDSLDKSLDPYVIAERGAELCLAAEDAFKELEKTAPNAIHPVYVIGSEVPVPGGTQEDEGIKVTAASDFKETVELFKNAFSKRSLDYTWKNVIAVVVQPGVEFGDDVIHGYNRGAAVELCNTLKQYPDLVFEGHSTDYQNASALKQMVEDGIAILKVGPALTFALREGLFMLNHIENELLGNRSDIRLSRFIETLEEAMFKNPENWERYYHGTESDKRLARKYSYSDRCRYYLTLPEVQDSIKTLVYNLKSVDIPLTLVSQYLPVQYRKIRYGQLKNDPEALLKDKVVNLIDDYCYAVEQQ